MSWGRYEARMGGKTNTYILVEKVKGKTLLGRPKRRWEDNIKMNFKHI
jgi:RNase P/RNase MRP subunit p29